MYWHKNSAEFKALCLQAYNVATKNLDIELSKKHDKPLAIIADIDETILNNTTYNEWLIKENESFNQENWTKWVNRIFKVSLPIYYNITSLSAISRTDFFKDTRDLML